MKLGGLAVCKVLWLNCRVRQNKHTLALVRGLNFIEDLINKSKKYGIHIWYSTIRQDTEHSLRTHKKVWHGMAQHSTVRYISVYLFQSCFTLITFQLGFPLSRNFSNFQVPGLLDLLSPGTTGPRDLQGLQVLSCLVPGPRTSCPGISRDVPGLNWKAICEKKLQKINSKVHVFLFLQVFWQPQW